MSAAALDGAGKPIGEAIQAKKTADGWDDAPREPRDHLVRGFGPPMSSPTVHLAVHRLLSSLRLSLRSLRLCVEIALSLVTAALGQPGYTHPNACAVCHAQIAETYARTGMARSFYPRARRPPPPYRRPRYTDASGKTLGCGPRWQKHLGLKQDESTLK